MYYYYTLIDSVCILRDMETSSFTKFVCIVCSEREGAVEGYVELALYYCSKPLGTIGLSVLEGGREGGREGGERKRVYVFVSLVIITSTAKSIAERLKRDALDFFFSLSSI